MMAVNRTLLWALVCGATTCAAVAFALAARTPVARADNAEVAGAEVVGADVAPLKIAFLVDSFQVERWQTDAAAFEKRAKALGADVVSESADGDDELQLQQAQTLIDSGVGAIVLVAHDTRKAARIVAAAKAKNVPVICYDRLVPNSDFNFFAGPNYEYIGELQASTLVKLAPKGNYVLVEGSPVDINAQLQHQGHLKILQPYIDRGDIHVVSEVWAKDWSPVEAYAAVAAAIDRAKGPKGRIAAVVAANDGTAGGAIQALEERKLAGTIPVSGQDADLAAVIRLLNGTQAMTVYKPIGILASRSAEIAVSLARGEAVQSTETIANGNGTVPAYLVDSIVVNRRNVMKTVIKPGFQNLETIKKSLPRDKWPQ
jgi:D-xylose transport system substrate-binding protein